MARALSTVVLLTVLALVAFAGNSVLCRLALRDLAIDPWSFTAVRLASGALVLAPLLRARSGSEAEPWRPVAGFALLAYALCFSLAYTSLAAGTGALLLFGCVQVTMLGVGFVQGERAGPAFFIGVTAALAGVVVLVLPGLRAPDPLGAALMAVAGVAWATYSLLGRSTRRPLQANAQNFAIAGACGAALLCVVPGEARWSSAGVALAVASGTLTSAVGYVLWYAALPSLRATSAAVLQLAVPVLAAAAGAALLDESPSPRLLLAGALTLGGIALALRSRRPEAS